MAMNIESSAFHDHEEIPEVFTCQGQDVSPPLSWDDVPAQAKSLVLIVDDPDAPDPAAPKMTWVHWVLFNLPPGSTGLPEAVLDEQLPKGTLHGTNDWKRTGYGGPCPPIGKHRYFFKLYALDIELPHLHQPTKGMLEAAMENHILDESHLVGFYEKS